jgi:hypothetical protein
MVANENAWIVSMMRPESSSTVDIYIWIVQFHLFLEQAVESGMRLCEVLQMVGAVCQDIEDREEKEQCLSKWAKFGPCLGSEWSRSG